MTDPVEPEHLKERERLKPVAWRYRYINDNGPSGWTVRQTPIQSRAAEAYWSAIEAEPLFSLDALQASETERDFYKVRWEAACELEADDVAEMRREADQRKARAAAVEIEVGKILSCDREALADHRPKWGLADCVDNAGSPYQSQFLADALSRLRALSGGLGEGS